MLRSSGHVPEIYRIRQYIETVGAAQFKKMFFLENNRKAAKKLKDLVRLQKPNWDPVDLVTSDSQKLIPRISMDHTDKTPTILYRAYVDRSGSIPTFIKISNPVTDIVTLGLNSPQIGEFGSCLRFYRSN